MTGLVVILIAITVTPIFVVNAFRVLSSDWFVRHELGQDDFPADRYGLEGDDRLALALIGLRSIQPGTDGIALLERATLPDGSPAFDGRELRHMADVRRLLGTGASVATHRRRRSPRPRDRAASLLAVAHRRSPRPPGRSLRHLRHRSAGGADHPARVRRLLRPVPFGVLRRRLVEVLDHRHASPVVPRGVLAGHVAARCGASSSLRRWSSPSRATWWLRRLRPEQEPSVIDVRREGLPYLRIGHRGAATLAPENTLDSFRAAIAVGVDLIEFDVLDLKGGPLVLAHSDHLDEVSHGAASGRVRSKSLEELREVAPNLPTFDEALAFFVDEAPEIGLHVDLKLKTRLDEVADGAHAVRARGQDRDQRLSRSEPARRRARSAARADRVTYPGGPPLDLPQAVPLADRLARALVDASVGRRCGCPGSPVAWGPRPSCCSTASSRSRRWRSATPRDCRS